MNQDQRVDELLKDLDTALSIDPSPAVAANVRERISTEPASGWWSRYVAGQTFRSAGFAAAALVLTAAGVFLLWPRATNEPAVQQQAQSHEAPPTPGPIAPPPASHLAATTTAAVRPPKTVRPSVTQTASVAHEPEVLISPATRRAIEQLQAAARAGRITEASFLERPLSTDIEVIDVKPIAIDVVKIEPPSTTSGGGTVR